MTLSIPNVTLSLQYFQPNITEPSISLRTIREANGNINQIIKLLNENKEVCLELFRKAKEEEDSITQIELSQAYCGITCIEEDSKKPSTQSKELDEFCYYPNDFYFFTKTYRDAMECEADYKTEKELAEKTFSDAANRNYLPAFLELTHTTWRNHTKSYGFAVQLQPYVNQGNKVIDYYFGQALKHGSQPGSKLFYEGLYWMHKSNGIQVQFPEKNEDFEDFSFRYCRKSIYSYYEQDGFVFANEGSPILAPSREKWEAFVKDKLKTAEIARSNSYEFPYNEKKLLTLVKNVGTANCSYFEPSPTGQEIANDYERKIRGSWIRSLSLYHSGKKLGTLSVRKNTSSDNKYPFEICHTFKNKGIQPIIDLMKNVMIRTGSTYSAESWLGYLKDKEYLSRSC